MTAYYNEIEPYAAQWLRNLIAENLIAPGVVDERSIHEVRGSDLAGYTQCHFFAGLGGWSFALRLAGLPDSRSVWTGSCPCQPFSEAGKREGFDDPRHLWPQFKRLIAERRPSTVLGEQVAGASDWLRIVRSDLEEMAYAVGAIPMEAASADAEHYRDRYWFVAHGNDAQWWANHTSGYNDGRPEARWHESASNAAERDFGSLVDSEGKRGDWGENTPEQAGWFSSQVANIAGRSYLECPDGKWRRLPPPRVRWLGHGIPSRVAKLRAFGNAIDPRAAAKFITAAMECLPS